MSVAAGAITRMLREPARTREKMSRPFVSVPNGKPHSGGRLVGNWLSKIGSYRVTRPGKSAQKTQKASTRLPMTHRRGAEEQPKALACEPRALSLRRRRCDGASTMRHIRSAPEPDPRVERGVEDVGDQRDDEVHDPDHEHAGGQEREVLLPRGLVHEQADALVVEEDLDGDEAADEVPDLHRDDRDRRRERVAEHVLAHDDARGEALEVRGPRVVAVERLDHTGPRDARDVSEENEGQRQRRQRAGT